MIFQLKRRFTTQGLGSAFSVWASPHNGLSDISFNQGIGGTKADRKGVMVFLSFFIISLGLSRVSDQSPPLSQGEIRGARDAHRFEDRVKPCFNLEWYSPTYWG